MNDGEHYTLKVNNTAIVKYNYKTGAFVDTVMSLYQLKNCPLKSFSGYEFSPNEAKMLIYNNVKYRYRRTFTAFIMWWISNEKRLCHFRKKEISRKYLCFHPIVATLRLRVKTTYT